MRRRRGASAGRAILLPLILGAVLLAAAFASLAVGARAVPLPDVLDTLGRALSGAPAAPGAPAGGTGDEAVVLSRMPRTVLAVVVGAALGLSGVLMQGVTRNPLADPGILGVNAGAACAVVFGIQFLGLASVGAYLWVAFLGAAAGMVLVYVLAGVASRAQGASGPTPLALALSGAALSAGLYSLMNAALVTHQDTLDRFRFWQLGSVAAREWDTVLPALPFLAAGVLLAFGLARPLDGLAMGDDAARALGQRVGLTRVAAGVAVVLLCGASTAIAGPVGFVGLVVPHALRRFTGPDHRRLLVSTLLAAPALVLVADVLGRVILLPGEIPAGVLTALVGAPVFVALLRRGKGVGV
ncbi:MULTISPECIES: iron ABC transporter permease [Arthrobacter]|uniref:Iron ABC transporter permease n=2 Tax=Arthrobacter TaxID=1663 RepID=A0ABU9KJB1_9MICC|nr:iron ABC transporter permease [Arthrobacter sp. YJM1]MDP5226777.1 iron ABC transporter permease [Arthrobacter sp. YJM1]